MKKYLLATVFAGLLGVNAFAAPPTYVDGVPLASQISNSVRDCHASGKWNVPFITWGADEVTIQANGGLNTTSDSNFGKAGLNIILKRQDDFTKQVKDYLNCDSPFLRATLGMAILASDLTEADPRTHLIPIYQHSWSAGGDRLVARANIRQIADLKGKTIVVQRYGPHVDYLLKLITDAGLSPSDITIKFTNDLTGNSDNTPADALRNDGTVDAAMVISPDADKLTLNNTVGSGAEGSVKGVHQIISTKQGNRIITDIYFVRQDFYDANKDKLAAFTKALLSSEETVRGLSISKTSDWTNLMKLSAKLLLDDETDTADAEGMWSDAETTGRQGNLKFFADPNEVRNYGNMTREIQNMFLKAGYITTFHNLTSANWDWSLITGVTLNGQVTPKFDTQKNNQEVSQIYAQGAVDSSTLFSMTINFKPTQKDFNANDYATQFTKVIDLANTYGGAVITAEGHADPLAYLNALDAMEKSGKIDRLLLSRMVQAGRNLSVQRAEAVRDAIIAEAKQEGHSLDPSQFEVIGVGYDSPETGICGDRPCRPKTEKEWLSNMEVIFRVMNIQAEASAFTPAK